MSNAVIWLDISIYSNQLNVYTFNPAEFVMISCDFAILIGSTVYYPIQKCNQSCVKGGKFQHVYKT